MGISECFSNLLNRIQPTQPEYNSLIQHVNTIKIRIESSFNLKKYNIVGSYSRGTAIRNQSDIDLFVVLARDDIRRGGYYVGSNTVLNNLKTDLSERYQNTIMGRDGQAITVSFSSGQVDVVPAVFDQMIDNAPVYLIPDGKNDWMKTCPYKHDKYIKESHLTSGNKFKYVIQLLKYWRECRTPRVPIASFHIELLFAYVGTFNGIKSYSQCFTDALKLLNQRKCRAIQDPLQISGLVSAASSESQIERACQVVAHSLEKAESAIYYECNHDLESAKYYWNMVFNGEFPSR